MTTTCGHTISSPKLLNVQLSPFQEIHAAAHLYQVTPWHVWDSRPHSFIEMKHGRRYGHLMYPSDKDSASPALWPWKASGAPPWRAALKPECELLSAVHHVCCAADKKQRVRENSLECALLPQTEETRTMQGKLMPRSSCPHSVVTMSPAHEAQTLLSRLKNITFLCFELKWRTLFAPRAFTYLPQYPDPEHLCFRALQMHLVFSVVLSK